MTRVLHAIGEWLFDMKHMLVEEWQDWKERWGFEK